MGENLVLALTAGREVLLSVSVMFLLMLVGFVFAKKKIFTKDGIKQMTELVLNVVVPCVILNAYQREFEVRLLKNLALAFVFALIVHIISIIVSSLIFRTKDEKMDSISRFATVYSNCGFMALPLIGAVYGNDGVFYAVAYLTVFNVLYWTHGLYSFTRDKKSVSVKNCILKPGVWGTLLGVIIFLFQIKLPAPLEKTVSFISDLNTPVPMIILGTYLVNLNIKKILKNGQLWLVCFMRLVAVPVFSIFVAKLMGLAPQVYLPLVISCQCPSAVMVTMFAEKFGFDTEYSSQIVSVSTLLSIITIPLILMLAVVI